MPGQTHSRGGPALPATLLKQLGGDTNSGRQNHGQRRARSYASTSRKDKRKTERQDKSQRRTRHGRQPARASPPDSSSLEGEEVDDLEDEDVAHESTPVSKARQPVKPDRRVAQEASNNDRKSKGEPAESQATKKVPQPSRKAREWLEADEDEIAKLEKKLGIKSKKTPRQSKEDGLEDLLGGLDGSDAEPSLKRKRGDDEAWLESKRSKSSAVPTSLPHDEDDEVSKDDALSSDIEGSDSPASEREGEDGSSQTPDSIADDDDFSGLESEQSDSTPPPPKRQKENPYVAPPTNNAVASAKYIPPSLRGAPENDTELEQRLRRQIQGLLNKLSEANLPSITSEVDSLFRSHPRQYVTSNLIDLLLGLICDRTALNDTFIILHAGFIAAVYRITGQDFGARVIERCIDRFDAYYTALKSTSTESKELANLISLLSQLYNFHVVSADLIFDLLRTFLSTLTETHTELLLRIVRSSGPQLRQDDSSALKDIVSLLQRTVSETPDADLSIRTRFMIDTITDLKNNKLKAGVASSAVTSEQLSRMRKTLGTLNVKYSIKASEPLRITLSDVRDSDKKGKWWLVGASWRGDPLPSSNTTQPQVTTKPSSSETTTTTDAIIAHLHLTTPLRRSIALSILTSADPLDAQQRLQKLHLARAQQVEIPKVILTCVAREGVYNPFYAAVAKRLCEGDKGGRKMWGFSGLGVVERCGTSNQDDEDDSDRDDSAASREKVRETVQQARFFASLVGGRAVDLGLLLKAVEWDDIPEMQRVFLEVLLVGILGTAKRKVLPSVFGVGEEDVRKGLRGFLRRTVARTDLCRGTEMVRVSEGLKIVLGGGGLRSGRDGRAEVDVDDI